MRITREPPNKKLKFIPSPDKPEWLDQAEVLPNRNFITLSEKNLVDLVRQHGETTKASLVLYTDYSRTKITSCIDSLLNKRIIVANRNTEYSGGRRSKTFSLNGNLLLSSIRQAVLQRSLPLATRDLRIFFGDRSGCRGDWGCQPCYGLYV